MHIIYMLIIGLVVGALAKLIMPGRDGGGILATMALGVLGSFLAGLLGRAVGWYSTPNATPGLLASIVGALVVLGVYRLIIGRTHRHV